MRKVLLHLRKKGAIVQLPRQVMTSDYDRLRFDFAAACGRYRDGELVKIHDLHPEDRHAEVYFNWHLAGPSGAHFTLLRLPHNTDEQVKKCRYRLWTTRDVTKTSIVRIHELVDFSPAL